MRGGFEERCGEHLAQHGTASAALRRRGRPRDPDADARIRHAAAQLLLERGFDRMTVDEVAEHAGVAKATVYRRYPSKEDLAVDALETLFEVEIPVPDTGSLRGDLERVYADAVAFASSPAGAAFMRLAVVEACRDPRVAALYRRMIDNRQECAAVIFERARARGELRVDVDPTTVVHWLSGMLVLRMIMNAPLPTPAEISELVDVLLRGIGSPGHA